MADQVEVRKMVRLKSGGPAMTVTVANNNGQFTCAWFDGPESKVGMFPPEALTVLG